MARSPLTRTLILVLPILVLGVLVLMVREGRLADNVAARIDGRDLSVTVLDLFVTEARQHRAEVGREAVLYELVDTYLAGRWYRDEYGSRGEDGERGRERESAAAVRVGYDRSTRISNGLYALLRSVWPEALNAAVRERGWRHPRQALLAAPDLDLEALAPLLTLSGLSLAPSEEQWRQARQWTVARYRFDVSGAEETVTLAQLYQAQNIQMKVRFHNLDRQAMEGALYQYLSVAFVLHWFERHSGLDSREREWVRQLVADREDYGALLRTLGINDDPHADNPRLRQVAAAIPPEVIHRYYQDHQDQFVRIDGVRAEALLLPSQEMADRLHQRLRQAQSPRDEWRAASFLPEIRHRELGWLRRAGDPGGGQDPWLLGLAFAQDKTGPAAPARHPGEPSNWWLLWIHERQTGYQAMDSEAVRYEASYSLARQRIRRDWNEQLRHRRDTLSLRINEEVVACSGC